MNTTRIKQMAVEIEKNEAALKWLTTYGSSLTGRSRDEAEVSVRLNTASACPGAKEAEGVLCSFAKLSLPNLVTISIQNCKNTIDICRNAIRDEASKEPSDAQP